MAKIIGLPKLSPTMDEGTLVKWVKNEGDSVDVDDLLAEVETDKATMEFRSFDKGTLLKILVPEGETLAPDAPVAIIGKKGEDVQKLVEQAGSSGSSPQPTEQKEEAKPKSEPEPGGDVGRPSQTERQAPERSSDESPAEASAGSSQLQGTQQVGQGENGRVMASPLVRRIAREHEVDLRRVHGTGPQGRIIKRDVDSFLEQGGPDTWRAPAPGSGPLQEPRVEKVSSMRKTIARRLTASKQEIPHYYLTIDVDAEPVWQARQQINAQLKESGEKVSLNDLIIKAAALALQREPKVNASWQGDTIHYHQRVDVSVAVAIEEGLVTPVVRNADRKGVLEISREVKALAEKAKNKKLSPEEMTNGTFSVSNLGMFGIESFTAVINPPEGAILAVGTVRQEPVVDAKGQLVVGRRLRMTLSCDHRVVDGAIGAAWLATFKSMLESPLTMLL